MRRASPAILTEPPPPLIHESTHPPLLLLSAPIVSRSRLLPLTGIFVALAAWQIAVSLPPSLITGPIVVARALGTLALPWLSVDYILPSLLSAPRVSLPSHLGPIPLG